MNTGGRSTRRSDSLFAGGALLMIVCCAVGPAVLGAVAGSLIGGWLGIACALLLAAGAALALRRRRSETKC